MGKQPDEVSARQELPSGIYGYRRSPIAGYESRKLAIDCAARYAQNRRVWSRHAMFKMADEIVHWLETGERLDPQT